MEIRPIGEIFGVKRPDRKEKLHATNKIRESQDAYDKSNASGQREKRQDTVEISQAYREAQKAYKKDNDTKQP